ncbi:MAG: DUF1285 domain-containing protein [Rhodospirillales bacterium]
MSFADPHLPGVPPASPNGRVLYENLGISIDKDGIWHYHGSPIRRKELVCLFAHALSRDDDGRYWLVTATEMGPIDVADAPLLVVEMFVAGSGSEQTISLRTNVDEIVDVDERHPLYVMLDHETGKAIPYLRLDRRIEARVTRSVFYELVAIAAESEVEGRRCLAVRSAGHLFSLGNLDEES